jgi:hypothetical protein
MPVVTQNWTGEGSSKGRIADTSFVRNNVPAVFKVVMLPGPAIGPEQVASS